MSDARSWSVASTPVPAGSLQLRRQPVRRFKTVKDERAAWDAASDEVWTMSDAYGENEAWDVDPPPLESAGKRLVVYGKPNRMPLPNLPDDPELFAVSITDYDAKLRRIAEAWRAAECGLPGIDATDENELETLEIMTFIDRVLRGDL